jgi:Spy/CpxP family protein refolding chaperone
VDRRVVEGTFMSRSSCKRIVAALLVVVVCALAVPARAGATPPNLDAWFSQPGLIWAKGLNWLHGFWRALHLGSGASKMGAGHTSDGHSAAKEAF